MTGTSNERLIALEGRRRFGSSPELELDSLADRLCGDADLRAIVVGRYMPDPGDVTTKRKLATAAGWLERVRKLAITHRRPYATQLEVILRRARELAEAEVLGAGG